MRKKGLMAAVLALVLSVGSFAHVGTIQAEAAENLIVNGNFEDANNLEVWNGGGHNGGAVVTAEVSDTPIGDEGYTTYGKITGRTSNWDCFAYDVTDVVESGELYKFSFYMMLDPEDYKDASADMRTVEVSPHLIDGLTETYSAGVGGTYKLVLEPGVWTKLEGSFSNTWTDLDQLVLRFLEQGTNYGSGPGVQGTYYITGVNFYVQDKATKKVEKDIVDLEKAVNEKLGTEDFIVGGSIQHFELADVETMGLVTKHFNGLTLGNELKPESLMNNWNPKFTTTVFNGKEMKVPQLTFTNADKVLDYLVKWNKNNPSNQIKLRGHVLLWHSQTPDWFFREDYNKSGALVTPEEMNTRLEWYIASVAEHYFGEDSKYKDMFYAWDVVNEAVSDGSGTYRNEKENSRWWELYQSNEFIINAFRYANKYFPESVDLYYNDYNDTNGRKSEGIAQLLRDVKAAEGTRIDGMGMQGHYDTGAPLAYDFEKAARLYASIVDQVQLTEWDVKNSRSFVNTDFGIRTEYITQAEYYHSFYEAIQRMRADGINFSGMTFWGVIDTTSWLQTRNSVGGAADGSTMQYPLLFDGDYKAKPAFWAFADETKYEEAIKITPIPTPEPTEAPEEEPVEVPVEEPEVNEPADDVADDFTDDFEDETPASGGNTTLFIIIGIVAVAILATVIVIVFVMKKED